MIALTLGDVVAAAIFLAGCATGVLGLAVVLILIGAVKR